MSKMLQFLKNYQNEVIVGVLVLLFLIFKDFINASI